MSEGDFEFVIPKWVRHSNRPISTLDVHPLGELFATGGWDNFIRIWSLKAISDSADTHKIKNKLVALLRDHSGAINCVRFSPDGKYLASCGDDSMVFLWQRVRSFGKPSTFGIPESALKPNKPVQKWASKAFIGHLGDVTGICWSPDSQRLASCAIDGHIIVWDVRTSTVLWTQHTPLGAMSIEYDPLNRFIAVHLLSNFVAIYDTEGHLIKEIKDCLEHKSEKTMSSRMAWSPDGSFIGVPLGFKTNIIAPFFQRGTFNFAFALEGHNSPISCLASAPFLYKDPETYNYSSLFAAIDNKGVLSVWLIGQDTKPLFILDQITTAGCNDMCFSKDGKCLLIALESDPINREGGIICLNFLKDIDLVKADPQELDDLKSHLLGEKSFRQTNTGIAKKAQLIMKSLETKEKEVDIEVLQLTTEEVLERQVETMIDGVRTIQPVLLTAVEKQLVSFQARTRGELVKQAPYDYRPAGTTWTKPAALTSQPTHVIDRGSYYLIACDLTVLKLAKETGRRLCNPFYIGAKCRHLSIVDNSALAVGNRCFVIDTKTMECLYSCSCPRSFTDFSIVHTDIIMGFSQGKCYIWDKAAQSWTGGVISHSAYDASLDDIEKFAEMEPQANSSSQWFDFSISAIFSAYSGTYDRMRAFVEEMQRHTQSSESQEYLNKIIETLKSRWPECYDRTNEIVIEKVQKPEQEQQ